MIFRSDSASFQIDTRGVIPCSSQMENTPSQCGLKITQNSSRKGLCSISSYSTPSPCLVCLFWSSSSFIIIKVASKAIPLQNRNTRNSVINESSSGNAAAKQGVGWDIGHK